MILIETIINLIEKGHECEYLDFKARAYNKEKHIDLIKDIMAMANSSYEGIKYIITGVKHYPDNKRDILGIQKAIDEANYVQLIHSNIEPEINLNYLNIEYQGKTIGVFRIYNNINRPYILKKDYGNLQEGLCVIRKGSTQRNAKRNDFDEFYKSKKKLPQFKVPNHSERILSIKDDVTFAVIKDDVFIRNTGDYPAIDVEISLFLNVYIACQERFLAGDIISNGTISLSELDRVIMLWKQELCKRKGGRSANFINHTCYILVQFKTEDGVQLSQPINAGIGWDVFPEQQLINIGYESEIYEPIESREICFNYEINNMKDLWSKYIKEKNLDELDNIDMMARNLAWKIYQSGSSEAGRQVNELFNLCQDAQDIGKGIFAYEELKAQVNKINKEKEEKIKKLIDWVVNGANAIHRNFIDEQLENEFWKIYRLFEAYDRY